MVYLQSIAYRSLKLEITQKSPNCRMNKLYTSKEYCMTLKMKCLQQHETACNNTTTGVAKLVASRGFVWDLRDHKEREWAIFSLDPSNRKPDFPFPGPKGKWGFALFGGGRRSLASRRLWICLEKSSDSTLSSSGKQDLSDTAFSSGPGGELPSKSYW